MKSANAVLCCIKQVSTRPDVTKSDKSVKGKQGSKSQKSCAKEKEKSISSPLKDDSQSTRQIKKPVYRLAKTQATGQKPINKDRQYLETKPVVVPFHGGHCSSKAMNYVSGEDKTVTRSDIVERRSSKLLNINNAGTVPWRTEKTSKGGFDEKSSQRSPSKLKMPLVGPSLVSAKGKELRQAVKRRECMAEDPLKTGNYSSTVKTDEPTSYVSADSLEHKRRQLVKEMCKRHAKKLKGNRSLCKDADSSSASITKKSSTSVKHTASESSSEAPINVTSVSHEVVRTSAIPKRLNSITLLVPSNFKIPKKVQSEPLESKGEINDALPTNPNFRHGAKPPVSGVLISNSKEDTMQQTQRFLNVATKFPFERQDARSSLSGQILETSDTNTEPWYDQMQVVEELHLARSEKRLEVNVMESYGELTGMDIDSPEEGPADTCCRKSPQQNLILVLDTNILLSHLIYVKKIQTHGLGGLGFPIILIPWVVLQEMDSLKRGRGLSGSVAHLATPAISYIYNSLKSREPRLWGQSMQQAAESSNGLNAENNDDRVLQCCLQYQSLYPECALILCTNDKNLCSKALLSGVKALSKNDLEAEVERSKHDLHIIEGIQAPVPPHNNPQVLSPVLSGSCPPIQPHGQEKADIYMGVIQKDSRQLSEGDEETNWDLSRCISALEECLQEVLSDVLQVEMKAAYDDLWLEIVYLKPPWTLRDVLQCLKKHWIAVFGHFVPRRKQQIVSELINFFNSGEIDPRAVSVPIQEAKELLKAFQRSSKHVPRAISVLDNIFNKLQPQPNLSMDRESSACDVVMNDDDNEDKQPTSAQVSHQEVWAVFESIWSNVYQGSLEVFKALGFDPHTMQCVQPEGGPPLPQDALACLHKLSSMVSQLLQAFSSVLSSASGLEEAQTLLSIIHSNKIVTENSRLTAKDLLDCFSQPDYRQKLRVGGSQLMELQQALKHCIQAADTGPPTPTPIPIAIRGWVRGSWGEEGGGITETKRYTSHSLATILVFFHFGF
ncbi:transcriptional protein SWT1 isoform X2 [Archocentrus centrarchus]|uniref:transcriptional protein SWT1 isoform X2 n=1 Tax=Archocentrus centrarchus TaxID=63155 RepID=UPI0011E9E2A1|nr:transcriptional protein SWT1 isoform X2 [Archocentrus centrarchus]